MRSSRLVLVAALIAALVGLSSWWGGDPDPVAEPADAIDLPSAGRADGLSSTWFCAGSTTGLEGTVHQVLVTNPGDATEVRLEAYNAEGLLESSSVDVAAASTAKIDVGATFAAENLSIMVESAAGDLVVEHRLVTSLGADQVPCVTSASDEWHFPALSTVLGASARLVLFNPFSSDAGIDVTVARDDGVSLPPALTGIVVPAGTTKVIDLGESVQRREIFSISLRLRTGRVVAETVQTFDPEQGAQGAPPSRGVRMMAGVPRPASDWVFADGFIGPGVRENLVVLNPGEEKVTVVVQVVPFGGAELAPEPFELEVAPLRYSVLDLSAEGRIPTEGLHAIRVQTGSSARVVVGRSVLINGVADQAAAPEGVVLRPNLQWGATVSGGSPIAATGWLASMVPVDEGQQPMLQVHNPNPGIVSFTATVRGGANDGYVLADGVEVAAGDSLALPVAGEGLQPGELTIVVESESPIVVERLLTFVSRKDLAMGMAVPYLPEGGRTVPLAGN